MLSSVLSFQAGQKKKCKIFEVPPQNAIEVAVAYERFQSYLIEWGINVLRKGGRLWAT